MVDLFGTEMHTAAQVRSRVRLAAGAGLLAAATVYTIAADPHRRGSIFPVCPTKLLTGLDCPACGGLRFVHDAGHGDVSAMVHDNLLLLLLSPLIALLLGRFVIRVWRGEAPPRVSPTVGWVVLGVSIAWMVVRNLPSWPLKPGLYG